MRRIFITFLVINLFFLGCTGRLADQNSKKKGSNGQSSKKPSPSSNKEKSITVYVPTETADRIVLKPQKKEVKENNLEKKAIEELLLSSFGGKVYPAGTKLLSLSVNGNLAIVNFSREILVNPKVSASGEEVAIYAIVNTLTEFKNIKKVKLAVEGKEEGFVNGRSIQDFWGHVGLYDQPFVRNEKLID